MKVVMLVLCCMIDAWITRSRVAQVHSGFNLCRNKF